MLYDLVTSNYIPHEVGKYNISHPKCEKKRTSSNKNSQNIVNTHAYMKKHPSCTKTNSYILDVNINHVLGLVRPITFLCHNCKRGLLSALYYQRRNVY